MDAVFEATDLQFSFPLFLICLLFRSFDAISTYLISPKLALEANLLAKKAGWTPILILNGAGCVLFAHSLTFTIVICTVSVLVTASNLKGFLFARGLGEERLKEMRDEAVDNTPVPLLLLSGMAPGLTYIYLGGFMLFLSEVYVIQSIALGFGLYGLVGIIHINVALMRIKMKMHLQRKREERRSPKNEAGELRRRGR